MTTTPAGRAPACTSVPRDTRFLNPTARYVALVEQPACVAPFRGNCRGAAVVWATLLHLVGVMDLTVEPLLTFEGAIATATGSLVVELWLAHDTASSVMDWVAFEAPASALARSNSWGSKCGRQHQRDGGDGGSGETSGGKSGGRPPSSRRHQDQLGHSREQRGGRQSGRANQHGTTQRSSEVVSSWDDA